MFWKRVLKGFICISVIASLNVFESNAANGELDVAQRLSIWSELTNFDIATLDSFEQARAGNADALLMLYLFASGDVRSLTEYDRYLSSINSFVKDISQKIDTAPSEWRKGHLLFQAMHEHYFLSQDSNSGKRSNTNVGYSFDQSQMSNIFQTKKYNCISSSLLFIVLARKFELDVQGVLLPSHSFVQLTLSSGKILEIETP